MKKIYNNDLLFVIVYALLLFKIALANTTFVEFIDVRADFFKLIYPISISCIALKIILDNKLSVKVALESIIMVIIGILCYINSSRSEILALIMLLIGMKDVRFDIVIKTFLWIYGLVTIFSLVFSLMGIIDMYTVMSDAHGLRYSMGNTYPTDFAAGVFYMLLAYTYLKKTWKTRYSVIWAVITITTYLMTKAQTSFILSILFISGLTLTIFDRYPSYFKNRIENFIKKISIIVFPAFAGVSYLIVYMFEQGNAYTQILNVITNYRIGFASKFMNDYGVNMFGNYIEMTGAGWGTSTSDVYYYIDNGYYYSILFYGILLTVLFLVGFSMCAFKSKELLLNYILIFIAINALLEPRFVNYLYNPFLMLLGSLLYSCNKEYMLV